MRSHLAATRSADHGDEYYIDGEHSSLNIYDDESLEVPETLQNRSSLSTTQYWPAGNQTHHSNDRYFTQVQICHLQKNASLLFTIVCKCQSRSTTDNVVCSKNRFLSGLEGGA
ncbi:hypothetical protein WAI453_009079 [Rhynchosporium graminicola]